MNKFCLIGLGFIADRHVSAIKNVGGSLLMACDVDEEKRYKAGNAKFYTDWYEMIGTKAFENVDYVVICTPNCWHYEMIFESLERGKKVICEKPPIITEQQFVDLLEHPNIDDLSFVLQCRYAKELKKRLVGHSKVDMKIEVYRDEWYMKSWKADAKFSGGLLYNIGCHYFDLLGWWFRELVDAKMTKNTDRRCEGKLTFSNAEIDWTVAIDAPIDKQKRIFTINGKSVNLTQLGFESLHTKVYEEVLKGRGYKLKDFEKTLNIIEKIYASNKTNRKSKQPNGGNGRDGECEGSCEQCARKKCYVW